MAYHPRNAPCSHCGDKVLIVEKPGLKLFGFKFGNPPDARLEHADPSLDGDPFDGVDDACHRLPVTPRQYR